MKTIQQKGTAVDQRAMARWQTSYRRETAGFWLRGTVAQAMMRILPVYVGSSLRTLILRRVAGVNVGRETVFWGRPQISGLGNPARRLTIGRACWINFGCIFDLNAPIEIGDEVSLGHEVLLMTSTHVLGQGSARRAGAVQARPIRIGDRAWLGSRVIVQPGITIGAGAVVATGAVVTKDVAPDTLVGGVPARLIRVLDGGAAATQLDGG